MSFLVVMGLLASLFGGGCNRSGQSGSQSASQQPQMSKGLADIAFVALDHGIYSIQDGEQPLIPFVISEQTDGKRKIDRYMSTAKRGEREGWILEESLAKARLAVSQLPSNVIAYAIAYDGYITIEGTKYDAIFVEASERGRTDAVVLAQRYIPKTEQRNFERVGNPALCKGEPSRF